MSTIQGLFQEAQLAEAAYANFFANPGNPLLALTTGDGKFSPAQATALLKDWRVVDQSPPLGFFGNGFSATFRKAA